MILVGISCLKKRPWLIGSLLHQCVLAYRNDDKTDHYLRSSLPPLIVSLLLCFHFCNLVKKAQIVQSSLKSQPAFFLVRVLNWYSMNFTVHHCASLNHGYGLCFKLKDFLSSSTFSQGKACVIKPSLVFIVILHWLF